MPGCRSGVSYFLSTACGTLADMTTCRTAAAAVGMAGLVVPGTALAQSLTSSGALGAGMFTIVPLVLGLILGLPSAAIYLIAGRLLLGRWPRWWAALLPVLVGPPLSLWALLATLDSVSGSPLPFALAGLAEVALIGVMLALGGRTGPTDAGG